MKDKEKSYLDFPLVDSERKQQIKADVRMPKATAPKKKKLTPELLDQIARVQGTKRRVYKSEKELNDIYKEVQDISNALKSLPKDGSTEELGKRLAKIIEKLPYKDANDEKCRVSVDVEEFLKRNPKDEILEKLQSLKKEIGKEIDSDRTLLVKKIGEAGKCFDCGGSPCQCFVYLTKPLVKSVDGKYEIRFGKDWGDLDIENYLRAMKYLVDKKK